MNVSPGDIFSAQADGFNTGLVGTLGVGITDLLGAYIVARTTTGITESPPGTYTKASLTAPLVGGDYLIHWDNGIGGTADEDLSVLASPNVVSFRDFRPSPRYDGVSWRHALIYESATKDGPWVKIDDIPLTADADPAHPQLRNFTTNNATLLSGWYQVVFTDNIGSAEQPVAPIQNNPASQQAYIPSLTDVALKILSRTRDKYGNILATFTVNTTPTDSQVSDMIIKVAPLVADVIGDVVPDALVDDAQQVVAERVAMQIELDYYADQVNTGRSIYPQLKEQYESDLKRLLKAIELADEGDGTVVVDVPANKAKWGFPDPITTLRGRW